jgi:cellulose synthase/poly-beta-1,6-N-acetylglucosamine synthase-like glycosyltransferase
VRERHAEATLYNRLADAEWETPIGESRACGGIAMMRVGPLRDVGGFREDLIAGEEGELCIRLRQAGWKIWRLDTEMVLHDIAMTRFSQWWRRVRRGGHAAAEGMSLHGQAPEYHKVSAVRRAMLWGVALPVVTILGVLIVGPLALVLLLVWPLQVVRLQRRGLGWDQAAFMTLAKLPEAQGMLGYWLQRMRGARRGLIEYK